MSGLAKAARGIVKTLVSGPEAGAEHFGGPAPEAPKVEAPTRMPDLPTADSEEVRRAKKKAAAAAAARRGRQSTILSRETETLG